MKKSQHSSSFVDLDLDEDPSEALNHLTTFDIASYPSDLTLSVLVEMWNNKDIEIPDYQRNFVWSMEQASSLIESFLIGLPVPQVFFYMDTNNKSHVIDGQQRILSIIYYMNGYFGAESERGRKQVFRLQGLAPSNPLYKKAFHDLDSIQQRKLKSSILRAINIRQLSPQGEASCAYHIFERLNTGGTPLKPQEIRNCVFRGNLVRILRELNEDECWRKILGVRQLDRHQKDVELLLRCFAFAFFFDQYEKPMKQFLNNVMDRQRTGDSAKVKNLIKRFPLVTETIVTRLGDKPFHLRGRLNVSALDSVLGTLLSVPSFANADLPRRFEKLKSDNNFVTATEISTSDLSVIRKRFTAVRSILLD
jgi:hypothetical protein